MCFIINSNAYHIILQCISVLDESLIESIMKVLWKHIIEISTHKVGCCAIQKVIDLSCDSATQLMTRIANCSANLMFDNYGHYVVCHVITQRNQQLNCFIIDSVLKANSFESVCKHKSASLVIEKHLEYSQGYSKSLIFNKLLEKAVFRMLVQDAYGIKSKDINLNI